MAFQFFLVPIHDDGEAQQALNAFLGRHKVLSVDRRWVEQGSQSFWSFCVDYLAQGNKPKTSTGTFGQKERIDYKEKLPPEQFRVFSQLRELRKEIAQAEAVPVYTIFSNEQLAQMVTDGVKTKAALEKVVGVGEARVGKYGTRFVELLNKLLVGERDETNGKPV